MSWLGLTILTLGNFVQRMVGVFVLGRRVTAGGRWARLAGLVPLAIVSAVVAVQTFATRQTLVLDARVLGVVAAALAAWRRLPLGLVVVVAAVVTAGARALGIA
jgi:hypothetical protein